MTNDSGFLTSHQDISGKEDKSNKVSSWNSTTNNTRYPTEKLVKDSLDGKANSSHTHDDRYYTESEMNTKLNAKANSSHTHTTSQITDFPSIPSKTSDLTNDSGFLTSHQDISGKADKTGGVAQVTDANANTYTSIGSLSSGATQQVINKAINDKIATLPTADTNTTYTAGTGLSLNGTTFSIDTTIIPNGTNLNTIRTKGFYAQPTTANTTNMTNIPLKQAFTMIVEEFGDGGVTQQITFWDVNKSISKLIRTGNSSSWSLWTEVTNGSLATTTAAGLMSSGDKSKLNGLDAALSNKLDKTHTSNKGKALVTNASTGDVEFREIDTTDGGTTGSTKLITSGAVYSGLSGKANNNDVEEFLITTHGTTATGSWTATSNKLTSVTDGTKIILRLTSGGSGNATLNLTLANGTTTGAIPIYYNNTTRLTTHYGANQIIELVYYNSAWYMVQPPTYGVNNNDYLRVATRIKSGESAQIPAYRIIGGVTDSNGEGKYYIVAQNKILDMRYPILYCTSAINSGNYTDNVYLSHTGVNLQNTVSGKTVTSQKQIYIEGTAYSNNKLTVSSRVFVSDDQITSTQNGYYYVYIGVSYDTKNIRFNSFNPIVYKKTANGLIPVGQSYNDLTDKPSTFPPSSHTHDYSKVSVSPTKTSGVEIGRITVDGTEKILYQQDNNTTYSSVIAGGSAGLMSGSDKTKLDGITESADAVSFNRSLSSGTKIGTLTINGTGTDLYCQTNTNTTYTGSDGVTLDGTTFKHSATGTGSALTTATLKAIKYDAKGHITGVANPPAASTSQAGIVQLNDNINSTSTTQGATANAVKTAYDKANHSHPYASSSHNHSTWTALSNVSNGTAYVNEDIRMVEYYFSKTISTVNNGTTNLVTGAIPSDYLPVDSVYSATYYPAITLTLTSAGKVVARSTAAYSNLTVSGQFLYHY